MQKNEHQTPTSPEEKDLDNINPTDTSETPPVTENDAPDGLDKLVNPNSATAEVEPMASAPENKEELPITTQAAATIVSHGPQGKWKRFFHFLGRNKKFSIPLFLIVIVALLAGIPVSRYAIAGTFWSQDITTQVIDSQSHTPVSGAMVSISGKMAHTDVHGKATVHIAVGSKEVKITKNYYASKSLTTIVPILKAKNVVTVQLVPTGRQVPVMITNKITGKALPDITISAAHTEAKTNKKGEAIIVLPAGNNTVEATISGVGYNTQKATLTVTSKAIDANMFKATPAGKLYFLSNLSGKIDVVKTNLDGTERQTVVAGTGNEELHGTAMLASRDWKYLALYSKRDTSAYAKIYLIDTSNDSMTVMDEGTANFTLDGWNDHKFIYHVYRTDVKNWQPKTQAIKSFDAMTKKIVTLDETTAGGTSETDYIGQQFGIAYILGDEIVYNTNWYATSSQDTQLRTKTATLNSVKSDGSSKHVVHSFVPSAPSTGSYLYAVNIQLKSYEPHGVYVEFYDIGVGKETFYEYEDGQLKDAPTVTNETFSPTTYPTYLASPSGKQTFWSDIRDGKNTLFTGDDDAKNGKQIATLSDYNAYGWYSDDYLLAAKSGSELYIMPADGGQALKVTDYYKPNVGFNGYGGGYGGQ